MKCPECGSNNTVDMDDLDTGLYFWTKCRDCGARFTPYDKAEEKEEEDQSS